MAWALRQLLLLNLLLHTRPGWATSYRFRQFSACARGAPLLSKLWRYARRSKRDCVHTFEQKARVHSILCGFWAVQSRNNAPRMRSPEESPSGAYHRFPVLPCFCANAHAHPFTYMRVCNICILNTFTDMTWCVNTHRELQKMHHLSVTSISCRFVYRWGCSTDSTLEW